jgi:hypothetical protein
MKQKSRQAIIASLEEDEIIEDSLAYLNKNRTKNFEEFFMLSAEEDNSFFSHA